MMTHEQSEQHSIMNLDDIAFDRADTGEQHEHAVQERDQHGEQHTLASQGDALSRGRDTEAARERDQHGEQHALASQGDALSRTRRDPEADRERDQHGEQHALASQSDALSQTRDTDADRERDQHGEQHALASQGDALSRTRRDPEADRERDQHGEQDALASQAESMKQAGETVAARERDQSGEHEPGLGRQGTALGDGSGLRDVSGESGPGLGRGTGPRDVDREHEPGLGRQTSGQRYIPDDYRTASNLLQDAGDRAVAITGDGPQYVMGRDLIQDPEGSLKHGLVEGMTEEEANMVLYPQAYVDQATKGSEIARRIAPDEGMPSEQAASTLHEQADTLRDQADGLALGSPEARTEMEGRIGRMRGPDASLTGGRAPASPRGRRDIGR